MAGKTPTRKRRPPTPRRKAGTPGFTPTPEQRQNVKAMIGFGMTLEQIARVTINPATKTGVSTTTLQKHFTEEIETGRIIADSAVANNLFKLATGSGRGAAACAIFWMKVRLHWKQTDALELTRLPDDMDLSQLSDDDVDTLQVLLAKARRPAPEP